MLECFKTVWHEATYILQHIQSPLRDRRKAVSVYSVAVAEAKRTKISATMAAIKQVAIVKGVKEGSYKTICAHLMLLLCWRLEVV